MVSYKGKDELEKLLAEYFEIVENDVKEVGNTWSIAKQTADTVVKSTTKQKGRGAGITTYQAISTLSLSPKEVLEKVVLHSENITKWSSIVKIESVEFVEGKDFPYEIYHQYHSPVYGGMISPRDFVNCRSWKVTDDELWFFSTSVEDERRPETKDYVRGDLFLSGWHAKLIDIEKKISKVHYIVHTNIKGSLPNWVVSKGILGEMAETFPKIRKIFE